jgi:hypothetical protein
MLTKTVVKPFSCVGNAPTVASKPPHVSGFFMAIYLDEQTGPVLKMLLKRELKRLPSNFVADRLLKMVEADDLRKETISKCEHDYQPMYGFHAICPKCYGLKDGYEIWSATPITEKEERGADNPPSSKDDSAIPPSIPTHPDAEQIPLT